MLVDKFNSIVREACTLYAGSETSGHRTINHNKAVGGAPKSQHLGWKCLDILLDNPGDFVACKAYLESKGLWVESLTQAKDHIHVDDRKDNV